MAAKRFSNLNAQKKTKVVDLLAPILGYFEPPAGFPAESKADFITRYYDEKIVKDYLHHHAEKKAAEVRAIELDEDQL